MANSHGGFAGDGMARATAAMADERRKLAEFQNKVSETTTVVQSRDRMVSMTFTGRGELSKLTFNNTRYRSMAPAELAAVITDTLTTGRNEAMAKLGGLMDPDALPGIAFGDLARGNVDLNEVVNAVIGPVLASLPDNLLKPSERAQLRGEA